jgi:DNA-binding NarL/FixJ family response regulator
MTAVFIVAPSPDGRDRLRHVVESDDAWVSGEGADLDDLALSDAPVDVVLLADAQLAAGLPVADDAMAPAVVVVSDQVGADLLATLRLLGAPGWAVVGADSGPGDVRAAILAAAAGMAALPVAAAAALGGPGDDEPGRAGDDAMVEALTPREREVLELLGDGLSNKDIGVRLGISEHTAKFHVASVLAKLGAHTRAEAVRGGIRRGLVTI